MSFTDLRLTVHAEEREVREAGLGLREMWPSLPGAIGLWLWERPGEGRSGSVSVWQTADDLNRFLASDEHVQIMRRFEGIVCVTGIQWQGRPPDPDAAWHEAERRVLGTALTLSPLPA